MSEQASRAFLMELVGTDDKEREPSTIVPRRLRRSGGRSGGRSGTRGGRAFVGGFEGSEGDGDGELEPWIWWLIIAIIVLITLCLVVKCYVKKRAVSGPVRPQTPQQPSVISPARPPSESTSNVQQASGIGSLPYYPSAQTATEQAPLSYYPYQAPTAADASAPKV